MNINATLFAQLIVFFILVWVTMKFIWPPVAKALDERAQKIANALSAAERGQQDLVLTTQRIKDDLKKAHQQAAEIVQVSQIHAQKIIEEAKIVGQQEVKQLLADAQVEIQQEILRAKDVLQKQLAGLVINGVEKILRQEMDPKHHVHLLDNLKLTPHSSP